MNCLLEANCLLKVKPSIEAKSIRFTGLPGPRAPRALIRARVPKGAGPWGPRVGIIRDYEQAGRHGRQCEGLPGDPRRGQGRAMGPRRGG